MTLLSASLVQLVSPEYIPTVYYLALLVTFVIITLLFSGVLRLLWNTTMPAIFSLPQLTYWQAFRMLVMAWILFGVFRF